MRINRSDHAVNATVEVKQPSVLLIGRLIERVVSGHPDIVSISLRSVPLTRGLTSAKCSQITTARS
jgi:hypothetical protein